MLRRKNTLSDFFVICFFFGFSLQKPLLPLSALGTMGFQGETVGFDGVVGGEGDPRKPGVHGLLWNRCWNGGRIDHHR